MLGKQALILDMNSTFMFGEDRFGQDQDYSVYYRKLGGSLSDIEINELITNSFNYLDERYPKEEYRHSFPTVEDAIDEVSNGALSKSEIEKVIETFSYHELGYIPEAYVQALHQLKEKYILALVVDIWSPKDMWVDLFKKMRLWNLFSASSFSSDHGMVKPSPKPFEMVASKLGLEKPRCLVVGDSVRRDLGGSCAAGIECILVGGAESQQAVGSYDNLLQLCNVLQNAATR